MINLTGRGIASLKVRANVVRLALWAFLVVNLLVIGLGLTVLARQMQLADPPLIVFALSGFASLLLVLFLLLGVVPILLWVHRAHANLHEGGMAELAYTPGWATGSYFVPFVNLVVPLRAMRELFNRSHGEPADFAQSSAGPVAGWWACHIPAVFLSLFVGIIDTMPAVSNVWITAPPAATMIMNLFAQVLWMGSAWFLLQTVNRITTAQTYGVATADVFE